MFCEQKWRIFFEINIYIQMESSNKIIQQKCATIAKLSQ